MNLQELATLVRDDAERWAREVGYEAEELVDQCAVCASAFVGAAQVVGIEAEIANGWYLADGYHDGHFWAFAWEPGVRGTRLVDLTLTQYKADAPRAAVLSFRDPEVAGYALLAYGDEARRHIRHVDEKDAEELETRVLAALSARGYSTSSRAPAATVETSAP